MPGPIPYLSNEAIFQQDLKVPSIGPDTGATKYRSDTRKFLKEVPKCQRCSRHLWGKFQNNSETDRLYNAKDENYVEITRGYIEITEKVNTLVTGCYW